MPTEREKPVEAAKQALAMAHNKRMHYGQASATYPSIWDAEARAAIAAYLRARADAYRWEGRMFESVAFAKEAAEVERG